MFGGCLYILWQCMDHVVMFVLEWHHLHDYFPQPPSHQQGCSLRPPPTTTQTTTTMQPPYQPNRRMATTGSEPPHQSNGQTTMMASKPPHQPKGQTTMMDGEPPHQPNRRTTMMDGDQAGQWMCHDVQTVTMHVVGVSSLDTPALKETCLVMFGKGFGVDIEFVQKRIIIIDFVDFSAHFRVRSPSSCHLAPLHLVMRA